MKIKYITITFFIVIVNIIFSIENATAQNVVGCADPKISTSVFSDVTTYCYPDAIFKWIYQASEINTMYQGDVWTISFGDGKLANITVVNNNAVNSTNLPAGISYGLDGTDPFHAYTYASDPGTLCSYRVSINAKRPCGTSGDIVGTVSTFAMPIFQTEKNVEISGKNSDETTEICEGASFNMTFQDTSTYNCVIPAIAGQEENGDRIALSNDRSEYRDVSWIFDFRNFPETQRNAIEIRYDAINTQTNQGDVTNSINTTKTMVLAEVAAGKSVPPFATNFTYPDGTIFTYPNGTVYPQGVFIYSVKVKVSTDVPQMILRIPQTSMVLGATETERIFSVELSISNVCVRTRYIVNDVRSKVTPTPLPALTSINPGVRKLTYKIVKSPVPPTVTSPQYFCVSDTTKGLGVTAATGTTLNYYEKQGTNPASLISGTSNFIQVGATVVGTGDDWAPTLTTPGVYTYYITANQTRTGGLVCEGPAATIEVIVLPTLTTPTITTATNTDFCVFTSSTVTLNATPNIVNVPVITTNINPVPPPVADRSFSTSFEWTVPEHYTHATLVPSVNTVTGVNYNVYTVNTASVTFNIRPLSATTKAYRTARILTVEHSYNNTAIGKVICKSVTQNLTVQEQLIGASVDDDGVVCDGENLFVTLKDYVAGRNYTINFADDKGNTYQVTQTLNGTSSNIQLTPNGIPNYTIGDFHEITIVSITDTVSGCVNDSALATLATPGGSVYPQTGNGLMILPPLIATAQTTVPTIITVCPGEQFTINLGALPATVPATRATEMFYNNTFATNQVRLISNNTATGNLVFEALVAPSIGNIINGHARRRFTTAGKAVAPAITKDCMSDEYRYNIMIRELPVVKITSPNLTVCQGEDATITLGDFAGVTPTTSQYSLTLVENADPTNTHTFTNVVRGAGGTTTIDYPSAKLPVGTHTFNITSIQEGTGCEFIVANATSTINLGTVTVVVRPTLSFGSGSIKLYSGNTIIGGTTGRTACANQIGLVLRVEDNAAPPVLVTPNNQTQYVWTLPNGWTQTQNSNNGAEVIVNVGASSGANQSISVAYRYNTAPFCEQTLAYTTDVVPGPPAANAGSDQTLCFVGIAPVTLAATAIADPTQVSGRWRVVNFPPTSTGGTFANSNSPTTTFTPDIAGQYDLEWSLSRIGSTCPPSTDQVSIFIQQTIGPAQYIGNFAGPDQDICGPRADGSLNLIVLAAVAPLSVRFGHRGLWTLSFTPNGGVPGAATGTFSDATSPTSTYQINNNEYGEYIFTWTISATSCVAGTTSINDTVTVNVKWPASIGDISVTRLSPRDGLDLSPISRTTSPHSMTVCMTEDYRSFIGINISTLVSGTILNTPTDPLSLAVCDWQLISGGGSINFILPTRNQPGTINESFDASITYQPVVTDFGTTVTLRARLRPEDGCPINEITKDISITFNRAVEVTNTDIEIAVCNGDDFSLNFQSDQTQAGPVTYNWEVRMLGTQFNTNLPAPFNLANATAVSTGMGNIPTTNIQYAANTVYSARLTVNATANGCTGPDKVFNIRFFPNIGLSIPPTATSVCSGNDYTLEIPLSNYFNITDNTGTRISIQAKYSVAYVDATQFTTPVPQADVDGIVNAGISFVTGNPTDIPRSFTIPAGALTLNNTVGTPQIVNVTVTTSSNFGSATPGTKQCDGNSYTFQLTVNPIPSIIVNQPIIQVNAGDMLNLTPTAQAGLVGEYTWTVGSITTLDADNTLSGAVGSAGATRSAAIQQTLDIDMVPAATDQFRQPITAVYTVTPYYPGTVCAGTSQNYTIVVIPKPVMDIATVDNTCSGSRQTLDATVNNIDNIAISGTEPSNVEYSYAIPNSPNYTITRNPPPAIYPSTADIDVSMTNTSTTQVVNVPITVTPRATFSVTVGGVAADYGADGNPFIYNASVNPSITITNPPANPTICEGGSFQFNPVHSLTTTGLDVSYLWTVTAPGGVFTVGGVASNGSFTGNAIDDAIAFTNVLNAPVTLTYTVIPRIAKVATPVATNPNDYCQGTPLTINLTVQPTPRITTVAALSICSGEIIFGHGNANNSQAFSVQASAHTLSWRVVDPNPVGNLTGLTANGNGDFNATVINTTTTDKSFNVFFTATQGTCSSTEVQKTITVRPGPTNNNPVNRISLCSLPSSTVISAAGDVPVATANTIDYTITPSVSITGITFQYEVTVRDINSALDTSGISIFQSNGTPITLNPAATDTAPVVPHFTHTTSGGALTSTAAGTTINPLQLKVINARNTQAIINVVLKSVVPAATAGGTVCQGPEFTLQFTIDPQATINNIPALQSTVPITNPNSYHYTICSGESFTFAPTSDITLPKIQFEFDFTGNRNTTAGAPVIGGLPATSITTDLIPATATILDRFTISPTHTEDTALILQINATAKFDNGTLNTCPGVTQPIYVRILPTPTVVLDGVTTAPTNPANNIEVCIGEDFNITISGAVANTEFLWTTSNNPNVSSINPAGVTSPYTQSGTSGVIANPSLARGVGFELLTQTLTHSQTSPQLVTYTITPRIAKVATPVVTNLAHYCAGNPISVTVTIHPKAQITNAPLTTNSVEVCSGSTYNFIPTHNTTGTTVSYRWELVSNSGSDVTISPVGVADVYTIQDATTTTTPRANPTITPPGGGTAITQTGVLNHTFTNTSNLSANLVFDVYPIVATGVTGKVCEGDASRITLNIIPNLDAANNSTKIRAVIHGNDFIFNPVLTVNNRRYDWVATVPANVEIHDGMGAAITAMNDVTQLEVMNVTNISDVLQTISFTITPELPTSTCKGAPIIVELTVLPQVIVSLNHSTPTNICSNTALGLVVSDNIRVGAPNINHTYDWTASAIGINIREVTNTPAAGTLVDIINAPALSGIRDQNGVAKAAINNVGTKVLTINDPGNNTANEFITYTFISRITHDYTDELGANQSISDTATASVTYTVIPEPILSHFTVQNVAGNFVPAGSTHPTDNNTRVIQVCRGQSSTFLFDRVAGVAGAGIGSTTGTPGSIYTVSVVSIPATAPNTNGTPRVTIIGNFLVANFDATNTWAGEIIVTETTRVGGCQSVSKKLAVTTIDSPEAHAGPDITICFGETATLGRTVANGGVATDRGGTPLVNPIYTWTPTVYLDPPPNTTTFTSANPVVRPTTTTTYTVTVSVPSGCSSPPAQITVTVVPPIAKPVLNASSGGGQCENIAYNHNVSPSTFTPNTVTITSTIEANTTNVEWYSNNTGNVPAPTDIIDPTTPPGGVTIGGNLNSEIQITGRTNNSYYFSRTIGPPGSTGTGCNADFSDSYQVDFKANPARQTITVSQTGASMDDNFMCTPGTLQMTLTASGGVAIPSYDWYYYSPTSVGNVSLATATRVVGANTSTLVLSNENQSGFYAVVPKTVDGCEGPISAYQEVIILKALSQPWITSTSASSSVCVGGMITITANLTEVILPNPNLAQGPGNQPQIDPSEVEYIWTLDTSPTVAGGEMTVTMQDGTAVTPGPAVTPYTGNELVITSAALTHAGNYTVIARRRRTTVQTHTVGGVARAAGSIVYCGSIASRPNLVEVIVLPPTPVVSIPPNTNPFCGDLGVSKSLLLTASHPTAGTGGSYDPSVVFKWERSPTRAMPTWTTVIERGVSSLTLTKASETGYYQVTATIYLGTTSCADAPANFPAVASIPDLVTIHDSPKVLTVTPNRSFICVSEKVGNPIIATVVNDGGFGPFTISLEVSIPNRNNPLTGVRTTQNFTNTLTLADTRNSEIILNSPDGIADLFFNDSTEDAIYRYRVTSIVDSNGCSPNTLPNEFEITVRPSPKPTEIRTTPTSTGVPAATITNIPDPGNPANIIRSAVVCGSAAPVVRFEIDAVPGTTYTWNTTRGALTIPGEFSQGSGGGVFNRFVELAIDKNISLHFEVRVTVKDNSTGCETTKELPITVYGEVLANAGDDYSICPETIKQFAATPAVTVVPKTFVRLGDNNNATVANNLAAPALPSSGSYTYEWLKKTATGPVSIPTSDFNTGSTSTDEKPEVSPTATTEYIVRVTDTISGCSISEDAVKVYVFPKPEIMLIQNTIGVCATGTGVVDLGEIEARGGTANYANGELKPEAGSTDPTPVTATYEYICENCESAAATPAVYRDTANNLWKFDRDRVKTNPANANKTGTYSISVIYKDVRACAEALSTLEIEVYNAPTLNITVLPVLCENSTPVNIEGIIDGSVIPANITPNTTAANAAALSNGQYRFIGSGVNLDTTTQKFVFDPSVARAGTHSITFIYKDIRGCVAPNVILNNVRVKSLPNISIVAKGTTGTRFNFGVCEGTTGNGYRLAEGRLTPNTVGATPSPITGADVNGVTYAGPGITADRNTAGIFYFKPSVAGVGTHTITFSFQEQGLPAGEIACVNSITYTVEVFAAPIVNFPKLPDVGKCANLFNLDQATVTPDLSGVNDLPNQPVEFYRDLAAMPSTGGDGYVLKTPTVAAPATGAMVIRQVDASIPPQTLAFQFDPARDAVTVGVHLIRYDYKDGFGCENVGDAISSIKILSPPNPTLIPRDPKDTNPNVSARKLFTTTCPNDVPFEITDWGSIPPTGNTGVYAMNDPRLSSLISTRVGTSRTEYWFDPGELKNISSSIIDITKSFSVTLKYTVTDANGCQGFDTESILITPIPTGTINRTDRECNGNPLEFRMDREGYAPFSIDGEYIYVDQVNGEDVEKKETFNLPNVAHLQEYTVPKLKSSATYRIIKITDRNGCVNASPPRSQATITAAPIADFSPDPSTQVIPNTTVTFENKSNSDGWLFRWSFGDGVSIEGNKADGKIDIVHADGATTKGSYVTPVHSYSSFGTYAVRLTAIGGNCDDVANKEVLIKAQVPRIDFTADKNVGCAPLEITFTNLSKFVRQNDYKWTFGENIGISRAENPKFTFTKAGIYKVTLEGAKADGSYEKEEKEKYITVYAQPDARFTASPTSVYLPNQPVLFSNISYGANRFEWDFGDGAKSTDFEPHHVYTKPGQYAITLKAINALTGCEDVFTKLNAIVAIEGGDIIVPNVFTPASIVSEKISNSDIASGSTRPDTTSSENNVFAPIVSHAIRYEMQVYDAWGGLIFLTKTQSRGWNGYYNGKLVPTGTYVYRLKVEFANGKRIDRLGDVTVIR